MNMKKCIWLLLALMLVLACSSIIVTAEDIKPILTLNVNVEPYSSARINVTYTAKLTPVPSSQVAPVITFYCDNLAIANVPVNNMGIAVYKFLQEPGKYQAVAVWENTPTPIKSNIVYYEVPGIITP